MKYRCLLTETGRYLTAVANLRKQPEWILGNLASNYGCCICFQIWGYFFNSFHRFCLCEVLELWLVNNICSLTFVVLVIDKLDVSFHLLTLPVLFNESCCFSSKKKFHYVFQTLILLFLMKCQHCHLYSFIFMREAAWWQSCHIVHSLAGLSERFSEWMVIVFNSFVSVPALAISAPLNLVFAVCVHLNSMFCSLLKRNSAVL